MNNYLSKSYLIKLLNHVSYLIAFCYLFFPFFIYHLIGIKFNLDTALQFKFQVSLKLGDVSRPRLFKILIYNFSFTKFYKFEHIDFHEPIRWNYFSIEVIIHK